MLKTLYLHKMKSLLCILMLLIPHCVTFGQVKLHSSYTQSWPTLFTTDVEEIDRQIWLENDKITIITQFAEAKEIEILIVESYENTKNRMIFTCTSSDGARTVTAVIPNPTKATALDLYRISSETGEEEQIRFHLDSSEKPQQISTRFKSI